MHNRLSGKLALFVLLLGIGLPAFAGGVLTPGGGNNSWDLYAFANGQVIANALSSISAMVAMPGYAGLLDLLGMISIVALAVMAGFDPGKHAVRFFAYVLTSFLAVWSMTGVAGGGGLTASVNVDDVVTNQVYNVNNVPAAIAVPAAVVSDIGQWLTQTMEQNFSYGNTTLAISDGGTFNMAASLTSDLTKVQIGNAGISASINNYMQDCVVPALANGALYAGDLLTSTSLWTTLAGAQNNALMTTYIAPQANAVSQVVTCANAYTNLTADLQNYLPDLTAMAAGAWGNTPVGSILAQQVTDATSWLSAGNIANGGATMIEQSAVLNQMTNSFSNMAAITNNNAMVTALALAQAKQSQLSGWVAGSQVFQQMMGYVYAVLQVFIFGITPIVVVAMLIPGLGAGILKNFLQVLIWLALWNPMFAVVSFIMNSYAQGDLSPLLQVNTTGAGTAWGLTAANIGAISTASSTMVAAGGFLGTMVPLIAWGLVKGQLAFTEFVTHGIGTSFANSAATEMATGNVSLGNQSIDLANFSKFNSVHQTSVGYDAIQSIFGNGNALQTQNDGGSIHKMNDAVTNSSTTYSTGMSAARKDELTTQQTHSLAKSEVASQQLAAQVSNDLGKVLEEGRNAGVNYGKDNSASASTSVGDGTNTAKKLDHSTGTDDSTIADVGANLDKLRTELNSDVAAEKGAKTAEEKAAAAGKVSKTLGLINKLLPAFSASVDKRLTAHDKVTQDNSTQQTVKQGHDDQAVAKAVAGQTAADAEGSKASAGFKQAASKALADLASAQESWQDTASKANALSVTENTSVGDAVTVRNAQALGDSVAQGSGVDSAQVAETAAAGVAAAEATVAKPDAQFMSKDQLQASLQTMKTSADGSYAHIKSASEAEQRQFGEALASAYTAHKGNAQAQLKALTHEVSARYNLGEEQATVVAHSIQDMLTKKQGQLKDIADGAMAYAAISNGAAAAYNAVDAAYQAKHPGEGTLADWLSKKGGKKGLQEVEAVVEHVGAEAAEQVAKRGAAVEVAEGAAVAVGAVTGVDEVAIGALTAYEGASALYDMWAATNTPPV